MKFPPDFLDEIRARVSVSEVVGRHTPLIRQGRNFVALCPFHDDAKPSLNIVDSKNFYHCFACGQNGDIFAFVMGTEALGFHDAVVRLAGAAGLELPQQSQEDRRRAARHKTLQEIMEAACACFENLLHGPEGRDGLAYLHGRGLTDDTIARFRLGFAPPRSTALRRAMTERGVDDETLCEVGLLRRPDDQRAPYDYFRGRVIFPISDRRGRVIAFGGRALGDARPKYLNSPDTPLFHKGRVLYGRAQAAETAMKSGEVIVAEGYMDVVALAQGGLPQTVAPLGTALTEEQIRDLWRLAREPLLCFDGDEAGRRAAVRAAERALPILRPGCSLRFVSLPPGQDPDDLIGREGSAGMRQVLDAATGLADFLWDIELRAQPVDTPERWAEFARRIRARVRQISDRTVQEAYGDAMAARLDRMRGALRGRARDGRRRDRDIERPAPRGSAAARARVGAVLPRRQDECVLAVVLNHPVLLDEFAEDLGRCQFSDRFLDTLRQEILDAVLCEPGLDATALRDHLKERGHDDECGGVLGSETLRHAAFARADATLDDARAGLQELLARMRRHGLEEELSEATAAFNEVGSEANLSRVMALRQMLSEFTEGAEAVAPGNA